MERHYEEQGLDATQECAAEAHLSLDKLHRCNDVHIDDNNQLLKMVCDAYSGMKPAGCFKLSVVVVTAASDSVVIPGPLRQLVEAEGMAEIIDLQMHPWGNNYYKTGTCGGAPYTDKKRHCWAQRCGNGLTGWPPADCFVAQFAGRAGIIAPENDTNTMDALFYLTAGQHLADNWQEYWPFALCMALAYDHDGPSVATPKCAAEAGFNATMMDGNFQLPITPVLDSQATPDHDVLPFVTVNGSHVEDAASLLMSVCAMYQGPKPAGCQRVVVI